MLSDLINGVANIIHNVVHWFQTVAPGGFGLILLPLIGLDLITLYVSRKP